MDTIPTAEVNCSSKNAFCFSAVFEGAGKEGAWRSADGLWDRSTGFELEGVGEDEGEEEDTNEPKNSLELSR